VENSDEEEEPKKKGGKAQPADGDGFDFGTEESAAPKKPSATTGGSIKLKIRMDGGGSSAAASSGAGEVKKSSKKKVVEDDDDGFDFSSAAPAPTVVAPAPAASNNDFDFGGFSGSSAPAPAAASNNDWDFAAPAVRFNSSPLVCFTNLLLCVYICDNFHRHRPSRPLVAISTCWAVVPLPSRLRPAIWVVSVRRWDR
jgi:hypothetical protein